MKYATFTCPRCGEETSHHPASGAKHAHCGGVVWHVFRSPSTTGWEALAEGERRNYWAARLSEIRRAYPDRTSLHRGVHPDPSRRPRILQGGIPRGWSVYWYEDAPRSHLTSASVSTQTVAPQGNGLSGE
jgi:hypothetical protein